MAVEAGLTVKAIFDATLKKLIASILADTARKSLKALGNVGVDFGDHFRQSYDKCMYVRTVLNRDESVELLSIYVSLRFMRGHDTFIDDFDFIDDIFDKKRFVITGGGGGGKTIFMKYLWLSLFQHWQSVVPLFIELRRFNEMMSEDFMTFLFRSIVANNSKLNKADFEQALTEGAFILLLDGFDEINFDRRNIVELEILKLGAAYPNLSIVVSSRPDEKFSAWQGFLSYKVLPLTDKQVVELIGKLNYDNKIKKKFIQRIKSDLYERHQSFLSSPLLATMMLLTFDQFADIPEKVYLFYEQAFETLFAKHDATKEAYKRKSHTGLPIDSFKKVLAYFCLISYYEQKHEYTDVNIRDYINKSFSMAGLKLDTEAFLLDLKESVCVLQREGLVWTYTHRSFQEYFSAYCITALIPNRMRDIIPGIIGRIQDTVIQMCIDMNKDQIENEYIIPTLTKVLKPFEGAKKSEIAKIYFETLRCVLLGQIMTLSRKNNSSISDDSTKLRLLLIAQNNEWRSIKAIRQLYRAGFASPRTSHKVDKDFVISKIDAKLPKYKKLNRYDIIQIEIADVDQSIEFLKLGSRVISAEQPCYFSEIETLSCVIAAKQEIDQLKKLLDSLNRQSRNRTKSINEIFSL